MTEKELADKVVAILGNTLVCNLVGFTRCEGDTISHDPLVAMALMEIHCICHPIKIGVMEPTAGFTVCTEVLDTHIFIDNESLPRAIIETCVEALGA